MGTVVNTEFRLFLLVIYVHDFFLSFIKGTLVFMEVLPVWTEVFAQVTPPQVYFLHVNRVLLGSAGYSVKMVSQKMQKM